MKLPLYTFGLLLNSANIVAAIFIKGGISNVATAGKRIYIKFCTVQMPFVCDTRETH